MPSVAQVEAGNYKKGHKTFHGLQVSVETKKGGTRRATDGSWKVEDMPADYGYIRKTEGADGEQVDVYLGDEPERGMVWVVDQKDADSGKFDEHKVMAGFPSRAAAVDCYRRGFSDDRADDRMGAVTPMTVSAFKDWLATGDTTKPCGRRHAFEN